MISESDALNRALHSLVMHQFKKLINPHQFRTLSDRPIIA